MKLSLALGAALLGVAFLPVQGEGEGGGGPPQIPKGICTKLSHSGSAPPASDCDHACPNDTCASICNPLTWTGGNCVGLEPDCMFEVVQKPTYVCRECPCNHVDPSDPLTWRCMSNGVLFRHTYVEMLDCYN
jgi:hypothetical protein